MNIEMNLALILTLALAATGSSTRYQAAKGNNTTGVRGFNLNHNETLVRDTSPIQQSNDWSLWLSDSAFASPLSIPFSIYAASCPKWVCGMNHNETLVRDTTLSQRADPWGLWMSDEQTFAAQLLIPFSIHTPASCPKWVCGANHNETLVRDTARMK